MIARSLVLRPVRRRPLRFLLAAAGVAAGVAAPVATVAASRAAVHAFAAGVEEVAGRTRWEVRGVGGVDAAELARLRPVADEAVVVPVIEEVARLAELGDAVRVLAVDLLVDAGLRPEVPPAARGEDLLERTLLDPALLLPRRLADELGVGPGDELTLEVRARPERLPVAAVFDPPRLESAWDRTVVMDVGPADRLFGRDGRLDRIEVAPREGLPPEMAATLGERLAALLPPGLELSAPPARRASAESLVASLRFNLTALSGISLLVAAVLVGTTLATSVVERRPTLALLRSLGASRTQLAAGALGEALLLGLVGGVAGVAAGGAGAVAAAGAARATVAAVARGVPAGRVELTWELALGGLLLALGVAAVAALLPALESTRVPPLQGLRGGPPAWLGAARRRRTLGLAVALVVAAVVMTRLPAWHGLPVAGLGAALALILAVLVVSGPLVDGLARLGVRRALHLGVILRLAAASLAAGRRRAAWAAGAAGVAVALAVAIATLVASFRATVVTWTEEGMRADLWVRPLAAATGIPVGGLDPEVVEVARALFGPAAVDPFHATEVIVDGRPLAVAGAAFDVVRRHGSVTFLGGRSSTAVFETAWRTGGVVVNEPFARRFGVGVGDTVSLPAPDGPIEREVAGVFHDYSRPQGLVVMDRADFLVHYPQPAPREVAVFLPEGTDAETARAALRDALGGRFRVEIMVNRELKREVLAAFERTFAITTALYLVAAVVAVVAVATVLGALVGERRRDLALLQAVGGSRLQIAGVVLGQALLLGLAGAAVGIAAGLAVGLILVEVVNPQSFGWSLRFVVPWGSLAALAVGVAAAGVAAGGAPALAALRVQPEEVLREEA